MTVDHSVKQCINESLPALLKKSGNLVLWIVVTLHGTDRWTCRRLCSIA